MARHGCPRAGRWPVQLRFASDLTGEEYVSQQAWRAASLKHCPLHPHGGCSFARHGTYQRVTPPGTRIPRWYCPEGHRTFSLLADCFAARLSGTLHEVEAAIVAVENARSLESAADGLRPDIDLPGAIRWTRRRLKPIQVTLTLLCQLLPEQFAGCPTTVTAQRRWLKVEFALPALRDIVAMQLALLPPPLGFGRRLRPHIDYQGPIQHDRGPDPPIPIP